MHRLAIGGVGIRKTPYVCAPYRVRTALGRAEFVASAWTARQRLQVRRLTQSSIRVSDQDVQVTSNEQTGITGSEASETAPGGQLPAATEQEVETILRDILETSTNLFVDEAHEAVIKHEEKKDKKLLEFHTRLKTLHNTTGDRRPRLKAFLPALEGLQSRAIELYQISLEKPVSSSDVSVAAWRGYSEALGVAWRRLTTFPAKAVVPGGQAAKTPSKGSIAKARAGEAAAEKASRRQSTRIVQTSNKTLSEHGLGSLSPERQSQIVALAGRLTLKYRLPFSDLGREGQSTTMDDVARDLLSDVLAVIDDKSTAAAVVNLVKARIQEPLYAAGFHPAFKGTDNDGRLGETLTGMTLSEAVSRMRDKPAKDQTAGTPPKTNLAVLDSKLLENAKLDLRPIHVEQSPVRGLNYGLDRALFNPGVYRLQDLRSKVYNFDPYLEELIPVQDFNFDLLQGFITSSKDTKLQEIARTHNKRYLGSSSSMTGVLSQFHYLLSRFRGINLQMMSGSFPLTDTHRQFSRITESPAAIFLRLKDDVYAIDSDKEFGSSNVLSLLGNSLEKLLTLDKKDYLKYRRDSKEPISEEIRNAPETYHYTGLNDILMRSQLDAHDPRLPGTGMFDLKTRAIWPVRMDVVNYQEGRDYEIKHQYGQQYSYEREYLDMLRATMIKYMLQVRIGRMDGIFVAFHNTQRIFGFQYISLEEIDLAMHGQADRSLGDQEFKLSVKLLNEVFDKATERFPNSSLRLTFRTVGRRARTRMQIFIEPVTEEEADGIQHSKDRDIAAATEEIITGKFPTYDGEGKRILDYTSVDDQTSALAERPVASASETENAEIPEEHTTEVGFAVQAPGTQDELDPTVEIIADAVEPTDELLSESSETATDNSSEATTSSSDSELDADEEFLDGVSGDEAAAEALATSDRPLLAMELVVENFVNGEPVRMPGFGNYSQQTFVQDSIDRQEDVSAKFSSSKGDTWDVKYTLFEVTERLHAWQAYRTAQKVRSDLLGREGEVDKGLESIRRTGRLVSETSREWRTSRDESEKGVPKVVVGDHRPFTNAHGDVEMTNGGK